MIHITSYEAGDVAARLVDHNETVVIESDEASFKVFLEPSQAWTLLEQLVLAIRNIELDDLGLLPDLIPIYDKIRAFQSNNGSINGLH